MISGIGIDIIELSRIKKAITRNNRFIDRILTENEKGVYETYKKEQRKLEYVAGRFAAKEAFAKATGKGIGKLSFQHIEILTKENGAPMMNVQGYEGEKIYLSITHSKQYAVAQVVITK
ncbi:holo-ACP synthase [Pseudogracilibacillus auburnensis]|uniref:Holo-[acyl-carrier-protein] synthase n=1 Tax=Pseudogracilibacillus auburnensis TaxID=1494959 RepID=A0A2V3VFL7_9BACI|nr:holo-ACP synthase [Pseudogracilibacillus auburnensis]PXW80360.1 holo-[acyl-carrier-protein] synthase [Pseudogracilibacillus auburnensis]